MTKIYTLLAISVGVVLLIISMFTPMREALIIIATVGLLAVYYKIGFVAFFILTGIGWIREILVKDVIITNELNQYVASLPGGASNVFMSLSLVIDFYKENGLLYGETFYNYFFQLLPSFVYSIIPYAPPKPFDSIGIFSMYDWNGGINFMSI